MAQFVNARHNDLIANAPPPWTQGTPIPPPGPRSVFQPAIGIQHLSPDSPFSFTHGTPPFVPPPPRNTGYVGIGRQQDSGEAPFAWTKGTPPFVPPNPRNLGYVALGNQQEETGRPPWSFAFPVAPQIQANPPSRGSIAFTTGNNESEWTPPQSFTRSTFAIPTPPVVGTPAYRASFVKAGGQWDLVSDAPFVFAAGFATAPPGPPPMQAFGQQHISGDAPFAFAFSFRPPSVGFPPPGQAFGIQQPSDGAPFSLAVPTRMPNPAGAPVSRWAFGQQQNSDRAPFALARGQARLSAVPPIPPAIGAQQPPDFAPWVWTQNTSPIILTFKPTFQAFGHQQPADAAPFSFVSKFNPGIHGPQPVPPAITQWAFAAIQTEAPAAFVWARGIPLGSTIPPVTAEILSAAIYRIVNANLLVAVPLLYQASNTIPSGYVIGTIPPTGSTLPEWSAVEIIVSSGPAYPFGTVAVPNVVGMTAQAARDSVYAASLSLDTYAWQVNSSTAGNVIAQSPPAFTTVSPGTLVKLTLSLGPPTPPIPTPPVPPPNSN